MARLRNQTRIVGGGGGTVISGGGVGGRGMPMSPPMTARGQPGVAPARGSVGHPRGHRRHRRRPIYIYGGGGYYPYPYPYCPSPYGCPPYSPYWATGGWPYSYPFGYGLGYPGYAAPYAVPYY